MHTLSRHLVIRTAAGTLLAAAVLGGCSQNNYLNENDNLRRENLELHQTIDQLQKKDALRAAQIQILEQQAHATARPGMDGAEVPRAVKLQFERFSGAVTESGKRMVRLYVSPLDQQGRFLLVAGRAVVQAVAIESGHAPALLAEKTFTPKEWDAAYRTGLTGTHYTIDLPLPAALPKGVSEATVKLTFTDAATGAMLAESRLVQINP